MRTDSRKRQPFNPRQLTCEPASSSNLKRILNIIASVDAEEQLAKLQQLCVQGRWLEWTDVMNSDLSWPLLLHGLDDSELTFSL